MIAYLAFYAVTAGLFLHKLYALYMRKAVIVESNKTINQWVTLQRIKRKQGVL